MKIIKSQSISEAVSEICIRANLVLRNDVLRALVIASKEETNKRAKDILDAIIKNSIIARREKLAICQDTGFPCLFVELGQELNIAGDLKSAINKGVELGYRRGYLRASVIKEPLARRSSGYRPALIHIDLVKGKKIKLTVLPKGFGCENRTQLKMFHPTAGFGEIKKFIIDAVKSAGPDACPPYIVGVGIGGTADYVCLLAKKALLRKLEARSSKLEAKTENSKLEAALLSEINKLNIGPMGLGGKTTALAVNIETYPTHIAGLPVAVNISCHALRSAGTTI